jgi:hypothetical protein
MTQSGHNAHEPLTGAMSQKREGPQALQRLQVLKYG